ncbi:GDSL family lipase [Allofrancisella guangzhouensis]|uniref:GDSL family lipase n=2 Tax=Allofrancisella guangzhouensis TaxID=594679 RepID=A0A0A8E7E9_9GAMM|nr:GDSL family lipase [Allofrancisella guangzhouensis]MBK2026898.1 GDSL family lipase [Allofrancisella guangzhouensis]MBK2043554.1 GDSL family lipase [Allofrancisella guangzhouensis]MBK2045486.1 GDSL family lipase [Allofrancisella guangzhouensis]
MRSLYSAFVGFSFILPTICLADARSEIILENNCSTPVEFNVHPGNSSGATIINKKLEPFEYINIGDYTNDKKIKYISTINIGFHSLDYTNDSGSLQYILTNGFTANYADFKNLNGNIAIEHQNGDYSHEWHSYTTTLKYKIPIFTVSACNTQLEIRSSKLKDVERILIFGDSLSDYGNLYGYTKGIIPKSTPYNKGMFSNGTVWSDILKNSLKDRIKISNYAVGGATVVFEPPWTDIGLPYTLGTELSAYSVDKGAHDTDKTLAIFFIGANDYLTIGISQDPSTITDIAKQVTDKIKSAVQSVKASKTLIIGLPDLSLTPESIEIGNQTLLKEASKLHNEYLKQFANTDDNVDFLSLDEMFNMLINDTDKFNQVYNTSLSPEKIHKSCWTGSYFALNQLSDKKDFYKNLLISNPEIEVNDRQLQLSNIDLNVIDKIALTPDITSAILAAETGTLCSNPQEFAFFDKVHPTYQVHKALFKYITNYLGIIS